MKALRFISSISKHGKDRYLITIPSSVVRQYKDIIEEWCRKKRKLVVEVGELAGEIQREY